MDDTPKFLQEIENKLKDRCQDYLVMAIQDGVSWSIYNSKVSALGMARCIEVEIENDWANNIE